KTWKNLERRRERLAPSHQESQRKVGCGNSTRRAKASQIPRLAAGRNFSSWGDVPLPGGRSVQDWCGLKFNRVGGKHPQTALGLGQNQWIHLRNQGVQAACQ